MVPGEGWTSAASGEPCATLRALVKPRHLATWLDAVRRSEIIDVVQGDERTRGDLLLGVHRSRIPCEVLGHDARSGQTDFTRPWNELSVDDLALLYGWFLMKGHLEELTEAFEQVFARSTIQDPV